MQISDREIRNSLHRLSETAYHEGKSAYRDPDTVNLLLARIQHLPEVRSEKVRVLRKAIREARYRVPSEEVAGKLLGRIIADSLR
ncbi:flagellar biosynthesis anti-sigma factor FlgM [Candidatus Solincola tengchongensis]|uniref:flagellar biosynthesis anti-sigma factor FlgM n=1 Tax=Candidatus Solincola tengchongensis TaxID=2900693 RepID=UPI00257FF248|nr:flagellar biosynthesis anti-sigma factor FlgM [Candidatus Solincola tengchongensis]